MHQKRCDVIYHRLRTNVINTILNSMKKTSFLWEQYDDVTGEGISGRPFTGNYIDEMAIKFVNNFFYNQVGQRS